MNRVAVNGVAVVAGRAHGPVVVLDQPLSFWGGFDVETGEVVDHRHPQRGQRLSGAIVVMESGRGSSSGSSVLAEAIRAGTAPAALLLERRDEILALGAIVADELYGTPMPLVVLAPDDVGLVAQWRHAEVAADGTVRRVGSVVGK